MGGVPVMAQPNVGDVMNGYRFKGGDPGSQDSWEAIGPRAAPAVLDAPQPGDVLKNHVFLGGDAAKKENWRPLPKPGVAKTVDDAVRSLAQGAGFEYADELSAATNAGPGALADQFDAPGFIKGRSPGLADEWKEKYSRELAYERARDRNINPYVSIPGRITGGIASTIAAAPYVPVKAAATATGRTAQAAGAGGALGALAGFGAGEGGLENRIKSAAVGGGIGAVAPLAVNVVAGPFKAAANALDPTRAAAKRLTTTMRDSGMSPVEAQARLRQLGPKGMVADIDDTMRQQLQTAVSRAPARSGRVTEVLEGRVSEAPTRVTAAAKELAGGKDFRTTIDGLTEAQKAASGPLYKQAAEEVPVFRSPEVTQNIKHPVLKSAYNQAKKDLGIKKDPPAFAMPHDLVDLTYKYAGDKASKAYRQGTSFKARGVDAARRDLRDAITRENKTYGDALEAFSTPAQVKDAAERGVKFWRQDVDDIAADMAALDSQGKKDAYLLGVSKALQNEIERPNYGSNLFRRLAGSPAKKKLLRAVFPDDASFSKFMKTLSAEGEFARTKNIVTGGSQTQPRQSAAAELGKNVAESAITGQQIPWMSQVFRAVTSGQMSPRQADQLISLLMSSGRTGQIVTNLPPPSLAPSISAAPAAVSGVHGLAQRKQR